MRLISIAYMVNDFLNQGGIALYVIFFVALLLWILILERFLYLYFSVHSDQINLVNEWICYQTYQDAVKIRETLQSVFHQKLYAWMGLIKLLITLSPLLGLLGTVYGMIEIFEIIAQTGTEDARSMAHGISLATLPTMSGMAIAITGLLFQYKLEGLARQKHILFNEALKKT